MKCVVLRKGKKFDGNFQPFLTTLQTKLSTYRACRKIICKFCERMEWKIIHECWKTSENVQLTTESFMKML
jgi:hypothetical protein